MDVVFYKCADDPRTIKKTITDALTVPAFLKEDVDLMRPVLFLQASVYNPDLLSNGYNYLYAFGRYYFVVDMTLTPAQALRVSAREDVLMTHADAILNCPAVLVRNSDVPNTYLDDTMLPIAKYKNQQVLQFYPLSWTDRSIIVCVG